MTGNTIESTMAPGDHRDLPARARLSLGPDPETSLTLLETVITTGLSGFAYVDASCRFVRANELLARLNGLRASDVYGRTVEEVVGRQYWEIIAPLVLKALAGEQIIDVPLSRESRTDPGVMRHVLVSYFPAESIDGSPGVIVVVRDVSKMVSSPQALRDSEARYRSLTDVAMHQSQLDEIERFFADLRERMRTAPSTEELLWRVVTVLGEQLQTDRSLYGEIDRVTGEIAIDSESSRGIGSMALPPPASGFGEGVRSELAAGRTVAIVDTRMDERTTQHYEEFYAPLKIRATIIVPIVSEGRQLAMLAVQQAKPRNWTSHEIALVEAVADRSWLAVENARLMRANQQAEARQRVFMRDILASVTEGRLHLCHTAEELPRPLPTTGEQTPLVRASDMAALRHIVRDIAVQIDFPEIRAMDLITATGEAAMNAVVHAEAGWGRVGTDGKNTIQVWVTDHGTGIPVEDLPQATLTVGYSTKETLGHGFKIMLHTADRVFLLTGIGGTTVVLEQDRHEPPRLW